jgi:uncharacterized protein (DUF849 family)
MKRSIITIAPNGARKTKEDLAHIPLWPNELAAEAKNSVAAGAAMIHLHVRAADQGHTLDTDTYRKAIDAIRNEVGDKIIVQATSESCGVYNADQQIAAVKALKPEAVSLAIREFIPTPADEDKAGEFFNWVVDSKIWPQFILYSPDEVRYFAELCDKRIIPEGSNFVLFVLGKKQRVATADAFAKPEDLNPFLVTLNEVGFDLNWAICAFGGNENACVKYALEKGGHARIGFENNHLMIDQSTAPSNAALVQQFVETSGTRPYTAAEVRQLFNAQAKAA